jgi:hypothetical protein
MQTAGCLVTVWNILSSRITCVVRSCRLESDIILTLFRTVLSLMNLLFAKVKASSPFGDVIIPWNNCRPDAGKRDLDGSTERRVLTGLRKNNEFQIPDRATVASVSPQTWSPTKAHWTFRLYWNLFLVTNDWAKKINPYWVFRWHVRDVWWIVMWSFRGVGQLYAWVIFYVLLDRWCDS